MKAVNIYVFGKIKTPELVLLSQYYSKLAGKSFEVNTIILKDSPQQKISASSLKKLPPGLNIALTEKGKQLDTLQFKDFVSNGLYDNQNINFFIGNAFGFAEEALQSFDMLLALSKLTFPHELCYLILLEQLFRVSDLMRGGSYHK